MSNLSDDADKMILKRTLIILIWLVTAGVVGGIYYAYQLGKEGINISQSNDAKPSKRIIGVGANTTKAIIYLAKQLEKHPSMQAYVLRHGMVKEDDEMIVIKNGASDAVYENINSPNVIKQIMEHAEGTPFTLDIYTAPGNLLELTKYGIADFNDDLKNIGIEEGYRNDVLYMLTKNISLVGRAEVIAAAAQLRQ